MSNDDEQAPWSAPWRRGHIPTAEQRREYATHLAIEFGA